MTDTEIDAAEDVPTKSRWYTSLFFQLLVAIVGGSWSAGYGRISAPNLKPLADGFIKLIKMLIAPIIFCTVVLGIAHVGDLKAVGRIGVKALIYFEVVTTFALVFGLLVGNVMQAGRRLLRSTRRRWPPARRRSRPRPATANCRTPWSSCSASSRRRSSARSPTTC